MYAMPCWMSLYASVMRGLIRSNIAGAIAWNPSAAYWSATRLTWSVTPKISCTTTTPPFAFPFGSATYASSSCPSAAVSFTILPTLLLLLHLVLVNLCAALCGKR